MFNETERNFGRLIKLTCLVVIAIAVIFLAMERLRDIVIPFMLALALSYLLTPLIDALSCKNGKCKVKLPRGIAVILSILVACCVLGFIVLVLLQAVASFRARSSVYTQRIEAILANVFGLIHKLQARLVDQDEAAQQQSDADDADAANVESVQSMVSGFLKDISITNLLLSLLGTATRIIEDVMYILLFLVFLLVAKPADPAKQDAVTKKVERQSACLSTLP